MAPLPGTAARLFRGRVVAVTPRGPARRHLRVPLYPLLSRFGAGGERVLLKVRPEKVTLSDPLRLGLPRGR